MSLIFDNIFNSQHITQVHAEIAINIEDDFIDRFGVFIKDCKMQDIEFGVVEVNMAQPPSFSTIFSKQKPICKMLKVTTKILPKYELYYKASSDGLSVTFSKYETMVKGFFETLSNKSTQQMEFDMRKNLGFIAYEKYVSLTNTMSILFDKTIKIYHDVSI